MANTIVYGLNYNTIELSAIDSDWDYADDADVFADKDIKNGLDVMSIQFNPGAADDVCEIRDGGASGALCFYAKAVDEYDSRIKYFPRNSVKALNIDYSDGTYSAGSSILITLWPEG